MILKYHYVLKRSERKKNSFVRANHYLWITGIFGKKKTMTTTLSMIIFKFFLSFRLNLFNFFKISLQKNSLRNYLFKQTRKLLLFCLVIWLNSFKFSIEKKFSIFFSNEMFQLIHLSSKEMLLMKLKWLELFWSKIVGIKRFSLWRIVMIFVVVVFFLDSISIDIRNKSRRRVVIEFIFIYDSIR